MDKKLQKEIDDVNYIVKGHSAKVLLFLIKEDNNYVLDGSIRYRKQNPVQIPFKKSYNTLEEVALEVYQSRNVIARHVNGYLELHKYGLSHKDDSKLNNMLEEFISKERSIDRKCANANGYIVNLPLDKWEYTGRKDN